jgi:acetolactate synthase small subunit
MSTASSTPKTLPPTGAKADAHTLVLRLNDRPGGMELVAATFAHRGISISLSLGHDGAFAPDGHATVLVHFRATPSRKEAVKAALSRLSRVVSVVEHEASDPTVRQSALVRLTAGAPAPVLPGGDGHVDIVTTDPETNETLYSLIGTPDAVDSTLQSIRSAGHLRAVTLAVLAL